MSKLAWNIEQLKLQLSKRKQVKGWMIHESHTQRRERYFMSQKEKLIIDQDRNVHSRNISLKLFVNLKEADRQGEITKKLFPSLPLENQIDAAIEAALQTDHQAWNLPSKVPTELPEVLTTDPKIAEDIHKVMDDITARIQASAEKKRESTFNSAELFLSVFNRELHLSNGLSHRTSQSRIYFESAYSYSNQKTQSDEYLSTQWAVHLGHLSLEKMMEETSELAAHSLDVSKPETGKYSVIISAEVLSTLLNEHLALLSAFNAYNGLPFIQPGRELIPQGQGDPLSITLDPTLDFGANTIAVSDAGLPQAPLKLVERNFVLATVADKQYGDYLGLRPTTSRGNLVVEPGTMTYEELTRQSPRVIEILQFSGLFTDPNSGTFSSEIRLAREFNQKTGEVRYLKGGSLSGSILENFRSLRLSKTRVNHAHFSSDQPNGQGYYGPEYALLTNVSIVG